MYRYIICVFVVIICHAWRWNLIGQLILITRQVYLESCKTELFVEVLLDSFTSLYTCEALSDKTIKFLMYMYNSSPSRKLLSPKVSILFRPDYRCTTSPCFYYPLANDVAMGYSNATFRPTVRPSVTSLWTL